jgi:hypothetical protein
MLQESDTPASSASAMISGANPGAISSRPAALTANSPSSSAHKPVKTPGSVGKLASCCPHSAHERSQGEPCSIIVRVEGFAGGHPAVLCAGRPRWMMLPRHYRRVFTAAHRVVSCDERDACDDWVMFGLQSARRAAMSAGYHRDDVDAWTMEGCLKGRL